MYHVVESYEKVGILTLKWHNIRMYNIYIDSNDSILVKTWTLNSYKIIVINDNNNNISSIFFSSIQEKVWGSFFIKRSMFWHQKDVINIKKDWSL